MGKIGFQKGVNPSSQEAIQTKMENRPDARQNAEGGTAFEVTDPSIRLLKMASGSFFNEETFYGTGKAEGDGLTENAMALIQTAKEVANRGEYASDLVRIAAWLRDPIQGAKIRLTPQILMAIAANEPATKPFVRQYIPKVVQRPDELRTLYAAYAALFGKTGAPKNSPNKHRNWKFAYLPASLRRGLMDAFCKFGEKDFAKYNSKSARPHFSDVLRVVDLEKKSTRSRGWNPYLWFYLLNDEFPIYKGKDGKLFASLERVVEFYKKKGIPADFAQRMVEPVNPEEVLPVLALRETVFKTKDFESLDPRLLDKSGLTWENLISQFGSNPTVWAFALRRMGYMAIMKNLRNMLEVKMQSSDYDLLVSKLTEPNAVAKSKLLPFRFWTAYKMLGGYLLTNSGYSWETPTMKDVDEISQMKILEALKIALDMSVENLPEIPGTTAIAFDLSGSMSSAKVSDKSTVTNLEAAAIMAAIVAKKSEKSIAIGFGQTAQYRRLSKTDSVMENMERAADNGGVGHSTNGYLVPMMLRQAKTKVDRLILISDEQLWDTTGRYLGGYGRNVTSLATEWERYKKEIAPDAWIHVLHIGGYDLSCTPLEGRVNLIGGFSEQVLPMCIGAEKGEKASSEATPLEAEKPSKTDVPPIDWIRANY